MISGEEYFVVYNCPINACVKVYYFQNIFLNINCSSCIVHTLHEALVLLLIIFTFPPDCWWRGNAFVSGAGGPRFKSLAGQIGQYRQWLAAVAMVLRKAVLPGRKDGMNSFFLLHFSVQDLAGDNRMTNPFFFFLKRRYFSTTIFSHKQIGMSFW